MSEWTCGMCVEGDHAWQGEINKNKPFVECPLNDRDRQNYHGTDQCRYSFANAETYVLIQEGRVRVLRRLLNARRTVETVNPPQEVEPDA